MFQTGKASSELVAFRNLFSFKFVSIFFCAMLVVSNVNITHADDEIKVPGLWAAVKDFWNFLSASDESEERVVTEEEVQDKNKQLVEIISDEFKHLRWRRRSGSG